MKNIFVGNLSYNVAENAIRSLFEEYGTVDRVSVVTDRDIVCRVVAEGKNPLAYPAEICMSQPVVTVPADAPLERVVAVMEEHRIRRVPVVDDGGRCVGIIAQADVAATGQEEEIAGLVREVSRESDASR